MATAHLAQIGLPDFGEPGPRPELPAAAYPARLRRAAEAGAPTRGYDAVVVYADREHSASMSCLTGFDPRFEEARAGRADRRRREPAILVGNECWGTAGAAPLPMRRHLFQDLSLQDQPRDRSAPAGRRSSATRGSRAGARVGVVGLEAVPGPLAGCEVPSYLADELRRLAGPTGRGGERQRPLGGPGRRPARRQRRATSSRSSSTRRAGRRRACARSSTGLRPGLREDEAVAPARLGRHAAVVPR